MRDGVDGAMVRAGGRARRCGVRGAGGRGRRAGGAELGRHRSGGSGQNSVCGARGEAGAATLRLSRIHLGYPTCVECQLAHRCRVV